MAARLAILSESLAADPLAAKLGTSSVDLMGEKQVDLSAE